MENKELSNQNNLNMSKEKVGFPDVSKPDKKNIKTILLILIPTILLVLGAYLFINRIGKESSTIEISPTPTSSEASPTPTPVNTNQVDKSAIKIQILNGSGISGAASILKKEIEKLGYKVENVGNAKDQNYTNTAIFLSDNLPQTVKEELLTTLESLYKHVESEKETGNNYDVIIITGYPKNYSPTPTKGLTPTTSPIITPTPTI